MGLPLFSVLIIKSPSGDECGMILILSIGHLHLFASTLAIVVVRSQFRLWDWRFVPRGSINLITETIPIFSSQEGSHKHNDGSSSGVTLIVQYMMGPPAAVEIQRYCLK